MLLHQTAVKDVKFIVMPDEERMLVFSSNDFGPHAQKNRKQLKAADGHVLGWGFRHSHIAPDIRHLLEDPEALNELLVLVGLRFQDGSITPTRFGRITYCQSYGCPDCSDPEHKFTRVDIELTGECGNGLGFTSEWLWTTIPSPFGE